MARDESQFWSGVVRKALLPFGLIARVENVLEKGWPDCAWTLSLDGRSGDGWLELKNLDGWPARTSTVVAIDHYTEDQRAWHRRWCTAGGRCFVAVRVCGSAIAYDDDLTMTGARTADEFFVFDGRTAAEHLGRVPRAAWYTLARWHGRSTFDGRAVTQCLLTP